MTLGEMMMAMDADSTAPTAKTSKQSIRWWPAIFALGLGIALQSAAAIGFSENLTYLIFGSLFIIWPLTVFLLLLWWTFASRLSWSTRRLGLAAVLASYLSFVAVFRFDEFDGAMIPQFSFRWRPTARDRSQEFFKTRGTANESPAVAIEVPEESDAPIVAVAGDWPEFRGPNRDDVVIGETLRSDWATRPPRQLWKQPIGLGWGSFAVVGRRAWTIEQRGPEELVVCYEVETGREFWSHSDQTRFESVQGGIGPRSTPTVHEGKVFTQGATGILNCLDAATGTRLWSRNTLEDAGSPNLDWGQSGSPLIVDDLVIVTPGNNNTASRTNKSSVIAYRRDTGDKVWAAEGRHGSYSSPQLATLHGKQQVLIFDGQGVIALLPTTGQRLWSFDWINTPEINAAQPLLVDDQSVLIGSGYGLGSALLNVTVRESEWTSNLQWSSKQFKLKFNGAVRRGDNVYGLDEGLLTCLDLKSGQRRWKQGRYGYGQIQLVDDKLLILSEEGDVVLVPATPELPPELARLRAINGKTWNHPVLSRGRLLVRNSEEAACLDLR
jgi:outer membrane protein assembly factor BamB